VDLFHFHMSALLDALVFIIIGWGIHRMSRVAAVAGLAFHIFERVMAAPDHGGRGYELAIIIMLLFISSVRATFAYHKYVKEEARGARGKAPSHSCHERPGSDIQTDGDCER